MRVFMMIEGTSGPGWAMLMGLNSYDCLHTYEDRHVTILVMCLVT